MTNRIGVSKLWVVSKNDKTSTQYLQKKTKVEFTDDCNEGNLCWSGSHSEQSRLLSYVDFWKCRIGIGGFSRMLTSSDE